MTEGITPAHGGQLINREVSGDEASALESKAQKILTNTPQQNDPNVTGYRFVDVEIIVVVCRMYIARD